MTHKNMNPLHSVTLLLESSALSRALRTQGKERDGCPLFSLPLLLSFLILLLSHMQTYPLSPLSFPFIFPSSSPWLHLALFVASFIFLLSVRSLPLLSFSGCLSASACMLADLSARRGCSYPPPPPAFFSSSTAHAISFSSPA